MSTRKLASIILAILVGGAAGFGFRDVGIGRTLGVAIALWIVLSVACRRPRTPLVSAARVDGRSYLLAVVCPFADATEAAARIKAAWTGRARPQDTVVRLVVPIRTGFLDRWASAIDGARADALRELRAVTASLAEAGIPAEASIGDEDVVQAVADEINLFPATEVVLLSGIDEEPAKVQRTSDELRSRLVAYYRHVYVGEDSPEREPARGPDHPAYRPLPTLPA
ncbi:MAG TPA: hypothetical protein VN522_11640 [Solirubrobacterales bacterium]|nr:hypothetical protein [Solirubrobacterales bacterium]